MAILASPTAGLLPDPDLTTYTPPQIVIVLFVHVRGGEEYLDRDDFEYLMAQAFDRDSESVGKEWIIWIE